MVGFGNRDFVNPDMANDSDMDRLLPQLVETSFSNQ